MELSKRKELLTALRAEILKNEGEIYEAFRTDFNKSVFDVYTTEVGLVLEEIRHTLKSLDKWAAPKSVKVSIKSFPAKGKIIPGPLGRVLIIAPWNYPFQLAILPLVGAIAAGNECVVKPSQKTPNVYTIIKKIISAASPRGEITVTDSREVLDEKFDYIFFTGGVNTGRKVLEKAAKNITPVTLELGGKSPCIIDKDANVEIAARRLAWGKFLNAGQTCVAPDYILVHTKIHDEFVDKFVEEIRKQYYNGEKLSGDFPLLINTEKAEEMKTLLMGSDILFGGEIKGRIMAPTVISASLTHPVMNEEVFAPLAPIIEFMDSDKIIKYINDNPKPLAFYYFGQDTEIVNKVSFGGGCINDVIMHVAESSLPFGGVGYSGMGSYHGYKSFETFSHFKSVLIKSPPELKVRYAPHLDKDLKFIKKVIR